MASVTYSAGIDHVSGALSKPSKSGQHSCEKMLLATHRTAATTSNKCNRLYLRTPVKRTSPLSQREFENRAKFMVVSGMIKARKADLMKITTDGILLEDLWCRVRRAAQLKPTPAPPSKEGLFCFLLSKKVVLRTSACLRHSPVATFASCGTYAN